jgi:hypothetical protein
MGALGFQRSTTKGAVGMQLCITFNNWDKYQNESKRVKNPSWFRFENKTYIDPVWYELDHVKGEFSAFLFLMMFVSQNGNELGSVISDLRILANLSRLPEHVLVETLEKLARLGIATCAETSGNVGKHPEVSRLQYKTGQDSTEGVQIRNCATDVAPPPIDQDPVCKKGDLSKPSKDPNKPKPPDLKNLWNSNCRDLPKILRTTPKRQRLWVTRWGATPDPEHWASVVKELAASAFCNGQNDRGWKADVDFFLQPDTDVKVLEGKYESKTSTKIVLEGL